MNRRRNRPFNLSSRMGSPRVNIGKKQKSLENIHRANLSASVFVGSLSSGRSPNFDKRSNRGLLNRCSEPNLHSSLPESSKPYGLRVFGSPAKNSFLNQLFVKAKRRDIRNSLLFVSNAIDESEIAEKKSSRRTRQSSISMTSLSDSVSSMRTVKNRNIEMDDSQVFVDCFSEETNSSTSFESSTRSESTNSTTSKISHQDFKEYKVDNQSESNLSECFDQQTQSSSITLLNDSDRTLIAASELTEDEDDTLSFNESSSRKSIRLLNKKNHSSKKQSDECNEISNVIDKSEISGRKSSMKTTKSSIATPSSADSVFSERAVKKRNIEIDDSQVFVECFSKETSSSTSLQNTIENASTDVSTSEISQQVIKKCTTNKKIDDSQSESNLSECFDQEGNSLLDDSNRTLTATSELSEDETITNEKSVDDETLSLNLSTDSVSSRKSTRLLNKKNNSLKKKCSKCDECDKGVSTKKRHVRRKRSSEEISSELLDDCFISKSSDNLELSNENKSLLQNKKNSTNKKLNNSNKMFSSECTASTSTVSGATLSRRGRPRKIPESVNKTSVTTVNESFNNCFSVNSSAVSCDQNKTSKLKLLDLSELIMPRLPRRLNMINSSTEDQPPISSTMRQSLDTNNSSNISNRRKRKKIIGDLIESIPISNDSLNNCFSENTSVDENEECVDSLNIEKESRSSLISNISKSRKRKKRLNDDENSVTSSSLLKDCFNENKMASNEVTSSNLSDKCNFEELNQRKKISINSSQSTIIEDVHILDSNEIETSSNLEKESGILISNKRRKRKLEKNVKSATTTENTLSECFNENSTFSTENKSSITEKESQSSSLNLSNLHERKSRKKSNENLVSNDSLLKDCFNENKTESNEVTSSNLSESNQCKKRKISVNESSITIIEDIDILDVDEIETSSNLEIVSNEKRKRKLKQNVKSATTTNTENSLSGCFNENSTFSSENRSTITQSNSHEGTNKRKSDGSSVLNDSLLKNCFRENSKTIISQVQAFSVPSTPSLNVSCSVSIQGKRKIVMGNLSVTEEKSQSSLVGNDNAINDDDDDDVTIIESFNEKASEKADVVNDDDEVTIIEYVSKNSTAKTDSNCSKPEDSSADKSEISDSIAKQSKSNDGSLSNSNGVSNISEQTKISKRLRLIEIKDTSDNSNLDSYFSDKSTVVDSTLQSQQTIEDLQTSVSDTLSNQRNEDNDNVNQSKTDSNCSKPKDLSADESNMSDSIAKQSKSNDGSLSNSNGVSNISEQNKASKRRRLIETKLSSNNSNLDSYYSDKSTVIDSTLQSQKTTEDSQTSVSDTLSNQRNEDYDNISQSKTTTTTATENLSLDNCFSENSTVSNLDETTNSEKSQAPVRRLLRSKNISSSVLSETSKTFRNSHKDSNSKIITNSNAKSPSSTEYHDDTSSWTFLAEALEEEFKRGTGLTRSPRKKIIINEDRVIPSSLNTSSSDLDDDEVDEYNDTINQFGWSGLFSKNKQAELKVLTNRVGIVQSVRNGVKINKYVILERDGTIKKEKRKRYRWLREDCKDFIKRRILERFCIEKLDEFIKYVDYIIETITKSKTECVDQTFLNSIFRTFAQHNVIKTPRDFYIFVLRFCPRVFREKVVPRTCFQSTRITIKYDAKNIDSDILTSSFC